MYLTAGSSIPIKELDTSVAEIYMQDMKAKCEEMLTSFKFLYKMPKVGLYLPLSVSLHMFINFKGQ